MTRNQQRLVCEAYRLSELRLAAEFTASQSADQRAMAFAGIMVAAAAVLAGIIDPASPDGPLVGAAFLFLLSAVLAGTSARPILLYVPGSHYRNFLNDIARDHDFYKSMGEMGEFNDAGSAENTAKMKKNSTLLEISFAIGVLGAAIAVGSRWLDS
jgi:hypothetical protein